MGAGTARGGGARSAAGVLLAPPEAAAAAAVLAAPFAWVGVDADGGAVPAARWCASGGRCDGCCDACDCSAAASGFVAAAAAAASASITVAVAVAPPPPSPWAFWSARRLRSARSATMTPPSPRARMRSWSSRERRLRAWWTGIMRRSLLFSTRGERVGRFRGVAVKTQPSLAPSHQQGSDPCHQPSLGLFRPTNHSSADSLPLYTVGQRAHAARQPRRGARPPPESSARLRQVAAASSAQHRAASQLLEGHGEQGVCDRRDCLGSHRI